jgi:hypothetical protein
MPGSANNIRLYKPRIDSVSVSAKSNAKSVALQKNSKPKDPVTIEVFGWRNVDPMNGNPTCRGKKVVYTFVLDPSRIKGSILEYTNGLIPNGLEGETIVIDEKLASELWQALNPGTYPEWRIKEYHKGIFNIIDYAILTGCSNQLNNSIISGNQPYNTFFLAEYMQAMLQESIINNGYNNEYYLYYMTFELMMLVNANNKNNNKYITYDDIERELPKLKQNYKNIVQNNQFAMANKSGASILDNADNSPDLPSDKFEVRSNSGGDNHERIPSNTSDFFLGGEFLPGVDPKNFIYVPDSELSHASGAEKPGGKENSELLKTPGGDDILPDLPDNEFEVVSDSGSEKGALVKKGNHQPVFSNTSELYAPGPKSKDIIEKEADAKRSHAPGTEYLELFKTTDDGYNPLVIPDGDIEVVSDSDDEKRSVSPEVKGPKLPESNANILRVNNLNIQDAQNRIASRKSMVYAARNSMQRAFDTELKKLHDAVKLFIRKNERNKFIKEKISEITIEKDGNKNYSKHMNDAKIEAEWCKQLAIIIDSDLKENKKLNLEGNAKYQKSKELLDNKQLQTYPALAKHVYNNIEEFYTDIDNGVYDKTVALPKRKWYQFWVPKSSIVNCYSNEFGIFWGDIENNRPTKLIDRFRGTAKRAKDQYEANSVIVKIKADIKEVTDHYEKPDKGEMPGEIKKIIDTAKKLIGDEELIQKYPRLAKAIYDNAHEHLFIMTLKLRLESEE